MGRITHDTFRSRNHMGTVSVYDNENGDQFVRITIDGVEIDHDQINLDDGSIPPAPFDVTFPRR